MKIHKLKSLIAIVLAAFLISACGGSSKADEIKVFTGEPLGYESDESLDDFVNLPEETEEDDEDADEDENEDEDEDVEEDEETVEEPEDDEDSEPSVEEEEPTEMPTDSTEESEEATETSTEPGEVTVEERLLIDQDGVKITVKGMTSSVMGPELTFLIENDTDKNLTVQARKASVNGYMVDTSMSAEVAAGKKANDELTFLSKALSESGITTFTDMEFSFHIFESNGMAQYFDSDMIRVETSAMGSYTQKVDDSGTVFYDQNGIKIIGKGLSNSESVFGPGLIMYIENNSGDDFTVQVRDTSVNGFMVDTSMSEDVMVGKKAITAVTFMQSSLEKNGITDITSVETSFHVFKMNGMDTIVDTEPITINF